MNIKVAICEDNITDSRILREYIKTYFDCINGECKIISYDNGDDFVKSFEVNKYNIVFLDIYLGDENCPLTGVDIAKEIYKNDENCMIIFVTNAPEFALAGYNVQAVHYLIKPIGFNNVKDALDRCKSTFVEHMRYIQVKKSGLTKKVLLRDIFYVEINNHKCTFVTKDDNISTRSSLEEVEKDIEDTNATSFYRCHRSYLVNLENVKKIAGNEFIMKNDSRVTIRKASIKEAKEAFFDYTFEKSRQM